jgi:drug/metabolite transporter (DMT)-like permease
MKMIT